MNNYIAICIILYIIRKICRKLCETHVLIQYYVNISKKCIGLKSKVNEEKNV